MSDKIVKKVENLPQLTAVKRTDKLIQRVAAYARVSTGKEEQQTSKGIACGLNNLQKIKDGEPLGGKSRAEDDFATDADDDFLA